MHFDCSQCKQKGFAHIFVLAVVLVLIFVLGGTYYFIRLNSPAKITQASKPQVISEQTSKENGLIQIPKVTAQQPDFNEYSSKDLGIGFRYAKELVVKTDSEEEYNKRNNGDFRKNFTGYVGYEPGQVIGAVVVLDQSNSFDNSAFTVWVFDNQSNLDPDAWFAKYWYYPFLWGVFDYTSKSHIALDNEATVSGQIAKYKVVAYQPGSPKYVYLTKNGKMYLLRVMGTVGYRVLATFTLQ